MDERKYNIRDIDMDKYFKKNENLIEVKVEDYLKMQSKIIKLYETINELQKQLYGKNEDAINKAIEEAAINGEVRKNISGKVDEPNGLLHNKNKEAEFEQS